MHRITAEDWLSLLTREAIKKRFWMVLAFTLIAISLVYIGLNWRSDYVSRAKIFVDESGVSRALSQSEGTGVPIDRAAIAREVIFTREIVDQVLLTQGMSDGSDPMVHRLAEDELQKSIVIKNLAGNLIGLYVSDKEPKRALSTAQQLASLFILRSQNDQQEESTGALAFLNQQVAAYRQKMADAEQQLNLLRNKSLNANTADVDSQSRRIGDLRREIDSTRVALNEGRIRVRSLERELSGTASQASRQANSGLFQQQITGLESQLAILRLDYTENHPDIQRIKAQIADARRSSGGRMTGEAVSGNPVYQQLQGDLTRARTEVDTLQSRLIQTERLLGSELSRVESTSYNDTKIQEMERDYAITEDIYQDLLTRRESQRVTSNLELDNGAVAFRIYQQPELPVVASGPRFMHFAALGLILGGVLPLVVLVVWLRLDPRIRLKASLQDELGIPVVAVIPILSTRKNRKFLNSWWVIAIMLMTVAIVYLSAVWQKLAPGMT